MEKTSDLEEKRKAVAHVADVFLRQNFGYSPKCVNVLMDQDLVVIRVDKFLCRAEIEMGKERRDTMLLHEMYSRLFDRVKTSLVEQIEKTTLTHVISSQININIESESCIMNFLLSPKPRTETPQLGWLMAPLEKD